MEKSNLSSFITRWNVNYPYDKAWREKHKVPLFSEKHKSMCLVDILLENIEDNLYKEAREEYQRKEKKKEESGGFLTLRDRDYEKGKGNWLKSREDFMTEKEKDDLFSKIKF